MEAKPTDAATLYRENLSREIMGSAVLFYRTGIKMADFDKIEILYEDLIDYHCHSIRRLEELLDNPEEFTPDFILEFSRNPRVSIHKIFLWKDDQKAIDFYLDDLNERKPLEESGGRTIIKVITDWYIRMDYL